MGLLDDAIANDMALAFLNEDVFAEEAIYHPKGKRPRTIRVSIDRDVQKDPIGAPSGMKVRVDHVLASTSQTTGIPLAFFDKGGDYIEYPLWPGSTETRKFTFHKDRPVVSSDLSSVTFRTII